jgi:hypothetical protein
MLGKQSFRNRFVFFDLRKKSDRLSFKAFKEHLFSEEGAPSDTCALS